MKQISIFIENEIGKLAKVTDLLAKNDVNLKALSIADTLDYGILRIITDDTQKAHELLTENGYLARINEVIEVQIEDKPGALAKIINALSKENVSVEYTYAFTSPIDGKADLVLRVNDNQHAIEALAKAGVYAKE